jgi:hypothetical protein
VETAETFEPRHPHLQRVWQGLGPVGRARRWLQARERQEVLQRVAGRRRGESERAALLRLFPTVDRSNFRRWAKRYAAHGFEGLFDWRMVPPSPLTPEVRSAICTLRRVDPAVAVAQIQAHVAAHHGVTTNATSIKEVLRTAGLARRRGPPARATIGESRLELGGMKLVEAAVVESGYVRALAAGVADQVTALTAVAQPGALDVSDRDAEGRFLASYNERYRRSPDAVIGPGFASVDEKRTALAPSRLHCAQAQGAILERKLYALLVSPVVGSGRWDGMRVPRGALLGELCGYPYMPATLDLFTRELKYLGVASTLWEIHAREWLRLSGHASAAVLYIDETTKPVWTSLFSQSTKVSHVGRVMPGLELVCFHTGYGVPLWLVTHSGRTPLVKVVPQLLGELEEIVAAPVGRLVVIDAEGNSIPFLRGLEQGTPARTWVTRLKPQLLAGKRIFNRTNYRAYRDGDRVRVGVCDLLDADGQPFRIRVVEVERRRKGTITYLGASTELDEREWTAAALADLYFSRWPNQEANFRSVNQAVGYGKQLVDNVTVVTELDKLAQSTVKLTATVGELQGELVGAQQQLVAAQQLRRRHEQRQQTVARQLAPRLQTGRNITPKTRTLLQEERKLAVGLRARDAACRRAEQQRERVAARLQRTKEHLAEQRATQATLASRRQIFRHDVELDSLFALLKFGLALVVTFVLKAYLGDARMEVVTFLERVATLPARLRRTPELELVTFDYNARDPDVMALLATHCDALNARRLRTRDGLIFRFAVDPAPAPRRPPPPQRRVNPGDRFR